MKNKKYDGSTDAVLERFMKEFFPFNELLRAKFFTLEMKGDYKLQAERVCKFFEYKTVYEHGKDSVSCHISDGGEHFITKVDSIYQ